LSYGPTLARLAGLTNAAAGSKFLPLS